MKHEIYIQVDKDTSDLMTEFANKKRLRTEQILSYLASQLPCPEQDKEELNNAQPTRPRKSSNGILAHRRGAQIH
jgi:hypothetical protein